MQSQDLISKGVLYVQKLTVKYKSLADLLERSAAAHRGKPLFYFPDDELEISYDSFCRMVNKVANLIAGLGIKKGDRVSVMLPNIVEFPMLWMAIARQAAVMVPTNNSYKSADLKYIINDSGAKIIFIHADYYSVLKEIHSGCPELKHIVVIGGDVPPGVIDFDAEMDKVQESFSGITPVLDDLVNIQYTSGTTGFPKGCMLSHKYWLQMGQVASDYLNIRQGDRDLCAQPFYYMDAQWNMILCMMHGIALVVMKRFSTSRHWAVCREYDVTFFYCIGTMPSYLASKPENPVIEQQHKLRVVICSGIYPQMHEYFEKRWNVPWREAFGMTETGVDLMVPLEDKESVGSGAMGKPIPSKEAKLIDQSGAVVPRGELGQLLVRGEPMMLGYWNNPVATAEIINDGWLHTGDLAFMCDKGYYHWAGRIKDMIRRAGENISAAEVESVLTGHQDIKLAAVVPVPDLLRGEEVKAYVVLKEGKSAGDVSPEAIVEFAAMKLSTFKIPRYIEYRTELPRTPSERVEKHRLINEREDLRLNSYDAVDKTWR